MLTAKIVAFHAASDQVSGAPRILADLRGDGECVSQKTVAKIMRCNGIRGIEDVDGLCEVRCSLTESRDTDDRG